MGHEKTGTVLEFLDLLSVLEDGGLKLVATTHDLILGLDSLNYGLQIQHLPLDEASQNLVWVLHLILEVVQAVLEVSLFLVLKQDELVGVLLLSQADIGNSRGIETTSLDGLLAVLLEDLDMACEDLALVLVKVAVEALIAAPAAIKVLLHL